MSSETQPQSNPTTLGATTTPQSPIKGSKNPSEDSLARHLFDTGKAQLGFYLCCCAQLCIFTMYNIVANIASTIHGTKAVVAMSIVYGIYIFSSLLSPVLLALVDGRASLIMFFCSLGYIFFCAMNIYGRIYTLCLGGGVVGCGGPMWTSNGVHVSKISLYCAERQLLQLIQKGELCDQLSAEHDPPTHFMRAVTDPKDQDQIDWYLSTIVDKNNRLLLDKLTHQQLEQFKIVSSAQIGTFTTISWLFMQASTIVGALIAFGTLHININNDPVGVFTSDTGAVRIMYGVFTFITILGSILYFIAVRIIPKRVYYVTNHLSKWDLHLRKQLQQYNPDCVGSFSMAPSCLVSLQGRIDGNSCQPGSGHGHGGDDDDDRASTMRQTQQNTINNDNTTAIATIEEDKDATMIEIGGLSLETNEKEGNNDQNKTKSPTEVKSPNPTSPTINKRTNPMSPSSMISVSQCNSCLSYCGGEQCNNSRTNPHSPHSPIYKHSRAMFPGAAANDVTDDDCVYQRPPALKILTTALSTTFHLLLEPSMLLLLIPMYTAYAPFSFTVSAFSSKGGVKDTIGVMYVPLFIGLVAAADCVGALVLKQFLKTQLIARFAAIIGLSVQLVSVILMYEFPYTGWGSKAEAWKYIAIIAILMGLGDSFSISGISTIISTMTRSRSELLSAGSSILMTARGLGLMTMFALTANTNTVTFRTVFWPIVIALISASILCHIISLILNPVVNSDRALRIGAYSKEKKDGKEGDVEMQTTAGNDTQTTGKDGQQQQQPTLQPNKIGHAPSDVLSRHRRRREHRHNHHHHHNLNYHPNMPAVQALASVQQ